MDWAYELYLSAAVPDVSESAHPHEPGQKRDRVRLGERRLRALGEWAESRPERVGSRMDRLPQTHSISDIRSRAISKQRDGNIDERDRRDRRRGLVLWQQTSWQRSML